MSIADWIQDWATRELADLKRVPVTIVAVLIIGLVGGWWAAQLFYAERIELLQLQRDLAVTAAAEAAKAHGVAVAQPAASAPQAVLPLPHISRRLAIVLAVVGLLAVVFVLRNIRLVKTLREDVNAKDGLLGAAIRLHRQLTEERDRSVVALKETKHDWAMEVLERYSRLRPIDGSQTTVTVKYASYDQDYELAQKIKGLFAEYVKWPVTLINQTNPALPRADKFKVVFDVGLTVLTYGPLIHAIADGDLLGVPVGKYEFSEREDTHNLIVVVLPSVGAQPIQADPA